MDTPNSDVRLDAINTEWSLFRLAHDQQTTGVEARHALVMRYRRAVRAYIGRLITDDDQADEVAQESMIKLMRGDFAKATPEKGRFRDLLKVSVKNLVRNHWAASNRRQSRESSAVSDLGEPADEQQDWDHVWRESLLKNVWTRLEDFERQNPHSVAYRVLKARADFPDESIADLAGRVAAARKQELTSSAFRQQLRRARVRFAQLLVEEVAGSLSDPTPQAVEDELISLKLKPYVADFLSEDWYTKGQLS